MKQIVMTTETSEAVKMGDAVIFRTGVAVPIEDDAIADSLTSREFPKFEEYTGGEVPPPGENGGGAGDPANLGTDEAGKAPVSAKKPGK